MALLRRPLRGGKLVTIFVSSSSEMNDYRRLFKALEGGVNAALRKSEVPVSIYVDEWEETTGQKNAPGEHGNAQFVERAQRADITCCLLATELKSGTKEELEAVFGNDEVGLSVMWCVSPHVWPGDAIGEFLRPYRDDNFVSRVGPLDALGLEKAIVQELFELVFEAIAQFERESKEVHREQR